MIWQPRQEWGQPACLVDFQNGHVEGFFRRDKIPEQADEPDAAHDGGRQRHGTQVRTALLTTKPLLPVDVFDLIAGQAPFVDQFLPKHSTYDQTFGTTAQAKWVFQFQPYPAGGLAGVALPATEGETLPELLKESAE